MHGLGVKGIMIVFVYLSFTVIFDSMQEILELKRINYA